MLDESKLRPFDLEAAKRGERVVRNLEGVWQEVIAGAWERDWLRRHCCLVLNAAGDRTWLVTRDDDLRMAPKTKTVWYALLRDADGDVRPLLHESEAGIRAHCEAYNMSILAIHSLEVEE